MKKARVACTFVALAIVLMSFSACKAEKQDNEAKTEVIVEEEKGNEGQIEKAGKKQAVPTVNIAANEKITSPKLVKVNSEGIWFASEGELGWVKLVDSAGNELGKAILTTEEDWMVSGPVVFSANLTFDPAKAKAGKLIIYGKSGEGDAKGPHFEVPVTF